MNILIVSFIEALMYFVAFLNICNLKFKKLEFSFFVFISYILSALIILTISPLDAAGIAINAIYAFIMIIAAYRKNKNIPLCILFALISLIVVLLSGSVVNLTFSIFLPADIKVREFFLSTWWIYIFGTFLIFSVSYFLSLLVGNFICKKLSIFNESLKKKFAVYLIIGTTITLALFLANIFLPSIITEPTSLNMLNAILLSVYFAYLIFAIYTFTTNILKEVEIDHRQEILENLQSYTDKIENLYGEMRKFRHDHLNMLLGLHSHIENRNLEGVNDYFMKYISPFTKSIPATCSALDRLRHIQVPELKSILSLKLMYAQDAGINVHIESDNSIVGINLDLVDLCRITGVLLDNAIEACRSIPQSVIKFAAIKNEREVMLIFVNTCPIPPPMSKIFEKGFSTKGDGRGMGLYILRTIEGKHNNVSLATKVENREFIQQLIIRR